MKTLVGNKIKKMRELNNFTQEGMAQKLNISPAAYSKLERDETEMTLSRLDEIAKIFKVDTQTILNFDEKQIFNITNSHQNAIGNREAHVYHNDKLVEHLEKEVVHLRNENTRLIEMISHKKERKGDPSV
jgi:transcriptional regulator with XRE-family HTH domain